MSWLIHVPVWGDRYHGMFQQKGWPSIRAALDAANIEDWQLVITSDRPFLDARRVLPIPNSLGPHRTLGDAHKQGIDLTPLGEKVVLLNADMIVSRELFSYLGKALYDKRFVACPTIRTRPISPKPGLSANELLSIAWLNRHRFTSDCIWPTGKCKFPPYIFTEHKDEDYESLVLHAFDLQPLALRKDDRDLLGPTASEIICNYKWSEINLVDRNQICIAETTSPDLEYARFHTRRMNDRTVTNWGLHFSYPNQQRTFTHQIVLRGERNEAAQAQAERWSNHIAWGLHSGLMPKLQRYQSKYWLAMALPYHVRQLFPRSFREWVKSWEWWQ